MELNEEQRAAVEHPLGKPACLIAGAGSGKTRVLTERVRWLMSQGVSPRRILAVTFTNKAAGEMTERLGISQHTPRDLQPRVSTIHALSLSAIRVNPLGFGLQEKVSPLDDYDQSQMMKKIIERVKSEENNYRVLEMISYHRARGCGFAKDYDDKIHALALEMHGGYHAIEQSTLGLWKLYEEEKTKNSVVDFDDMLHLVVRRAREDPPWRAKLERMYEYVLMDEAQDTNPIQWDFVNLLLAPDNPNLYVVGDMSQCQPTGTKVTVVIKPPRGRYPAKLAQKNIEDLVDGDLAGNVWSKHDQFTYSAGRKIKVAKRRYAGPMLRVSCNGGTTQVTPNHWLWVRFNKECEGKHLVYLMYRSDLGFRVGLTKFKKSAKHDSYGLSYRMAQEKADKGWILRVCDTRAEAECWEEIYSIKYSIPECCFDPVGCLNRKEEHIKLVFSFADPEGGHRCLIDHYLLWEFPIATRNGEIEKGRRVYNQSWRGYFKCVAANLVPGLMEIPQVRRNNSAPITKISRGMYTGWVYSLDVEKDHTYEADGVIVGNSIYGFNGAVPDILKKYSEEWRGLQPDLYRIARNHRSVPEIVRLANAIQAKMTHTIPLKMESWRGLQGEKGTTKLLKACLPLDIASSIAHEIFHSNSLKVNHIAYRDNCILVRSAIQIRDLEGALVRLRIPYIVRGGRGLLQTEEVRDVLSYLRLATNPKDFMALVRSSSVPRRGIGEVALEKIRALANERFDGDLINGADAGNSKLSLFVASVRQIQAVADKPIKALEMTLRVTNYRQYIADKYNKKNEKEKATSKLENLERFGEMIKGLAEENPDMTLADLVFQLSIDRQTEDDESGKVVISTIHSAKGLEWKKVFVFGMVEGYLPHRFSMGNEEEICEERRLFYVAATRARDTLVLCIHGMEQRGPNTITVAPSRFLYEIGIS